MFDLAKPSSEKTSLLLALWENENPATSTGFSSLASFPPSARLAANAAAARYPRLLRCRYTVRSFVIREPSSAPYRE